MDLEIVIIDYQGKELTKDDIQQRIEQLRKLFQDDEGLKTIRSDDKYLLRFLFPNNFNVEEAFKSAKALYRYFEEEWDWLPSNPVEDLKKYANMNMRIVLPFTDRKGKRLFLCKADTINPSKLTLTDLVKFENTLLEMVVDDTAVLTKGVSMIMDVHGTSWRLLSWLTPGNVKKFAKRLDNIIVKDIEFHVVRTTSLMSAVLKVTMPFLPERLKEKIVFHYNDFDSLHRHISPEYLPKEYGGTYDINYEKLNQEFLSHSAEINKNIQMYKIFQK